ncbi:MAG: glycine-rich protein [Candidatus Cybelea sp.]
MAAAVLAGCGYPNASTAPPMNAANESLPHHKTFNYTGAKQSFVVPAGVTKATIVAVGARGGGVEYEDRDIQALGGRVRAIIPVTPGEKLAVFVGGQGSRSSGGFKGGGTQSGGDRHTSSRAHALAGLGKAGESTPPTASSSSTGSKPK